MTYSTCFSIFQVLLGNTDMLMPTIDDNKYGIFIHINKLDRINGKIVFIGFQMDFVTH